MLSLECREMMVQIRISHLMRHHDHKYPLSWYLGKSDREIHAMYQEYLVHVSRTIEAASL